jgi:predicted ATPase/DNA-binding SARP family transcriptional activator
MPVAAPAIPDVPRPSHPRHNVPVALSRFVGRRRELDDLGATLARSRLVTLTGPGGAGKTRLARELAAGSVAAGPGVEAVWWVELAPVGAATDVPAAVAATLGTASTPGQPVTAALAEALRPGPGRRLVLVLDNCEHVVDAVAGFVEGLLRAVPGLVVLATSREALAVEGEVVWPVPPLARPRTALAWVPEGPDDGAPVDPAALVRYEAVELFVDRVRGVLPEFAVTPANARAVAAICARLDGLPLALELAAATVPALGVEALARRLDDAVGLLTRGRRTALPRHRTLRAVLDWSHALLDPAAQQLLARLSVFRDPFALGAAEAVAGGDLAGGAGVLASIARLVAHSLVEVRDPAPDESAAEPRYALLETVRQYGAARLRGTPDEDRTRRRHAAWLAALAEAVEPSLWGPERARIVTRLRRTLDDVRDALAWAARSDADALLGVRIAGALGWVWIIGVPWESGRRWLKQTFEAAERAGLSDADQPIAARLDMVRLGYWLCALLSLMGAPDEALDVAARLGLVLDSVERASALDDAPPNGGVRQALLRARSELADTVAEAHARRGEVAQAVAHADAALSHAAAFGDPGYLALIRVRRALALADAGRLDEARQEAVGAAAALRAQGDAWLESFARTTIATFALATGDLAAAREAAAAGVALLAAERDAWYLSRAVETLAAVLAASDGTQPVGAREAGLAARLLGAADALRRRAGARLIALDRAQHAATRATAAGVLGPDAFESEWGAGRALPLEAVFALAEDARHRSTPPAPPARVPDAIAPAASRGAGSRPALAIAALGPLDVRRHGTPLAPGALPPGKATDLLLLLVLQPEGRTREQIARVLWPGMDGLRVGNAFHVTLHQVRRALGDRAGDASWIAFTEGRYRLLRAQPADGTATETAAAPPLALDCDVDAVLAAAETLRQAERRRRPLGPDALAVLGRTLARRRGPLGQGLAAADWLLEHEDRVRAAWADGTEALARRWAELGDPRETLTAVERLLVVEPLRESAHRVRLEALAASGERARALAAYDALVALLATELGAPPARETQALADVLRR